MPGCFQANWDSPRSPNARHTILTRKPFLACSAIAPPARQTKSPGCAETTKAVFDMAFLIWWRLPRIRRRMYMPQIGAPMQRDKQHQQQPRGRIKRGGGDESDLADQAAGCKETDRKAVDREHAYAHHPAAEMLARRAHQDHRDRDHGKTLREPDHHQ